MSETVKNVKELYIVFGAIIGVAVIFKIIKIFMDGQAEGVPVKESLKKVKRVLCAAIICICLSSLVGAIQSYF